MNIERSLLALGSHYRRFCLFLIALFSIAMAAFAQNPNGSLRGEVQDQSGARVAAARIVLTSSGQPRRREATTNDRGEFRIEGLLPGSYRVVVNSKGFSEAAADVDVVVSFVRDITVVLKPVSDRESVNVEGQASSITTEAIDTASAVHGGSITAKDLETIPLAHRSFANVALMVPGTEPVEPSDPTKARITAVSFGGSSGLNVDLSVDGGDNSDDYIGGFLQNFSPDFIQEFAVHTSQQDADTGRTVGGAVVITTKHGTNDWHGNGAFYVRSSGLTARYPIDNPSSEPKQPFSRQNYIATIGGPLKRDKVWFFAGIEAVHENASISYSPDNLTQFNDLAALAADGLIPGVNSIVIPSNVKVPFRDYMGTVRFDYAQSPRSQWFLRGSLDNYTTNNDLIQQATLPSTGATSGSKYENIVLSNQFAFGPEWLGSFTFDASYLHHTEARNGYLGFALAFPFSATFHTNSGFETFGDNQFQTPITAFPVLRKQQKYQFRYDVSHSSGHHTTKFGVNFIHEPVLSGALSGTAETFIQYPNNPDFYVDNPDQFYFNSQCEEAPADVTCTATPAGNGSFNQSVRRLGLYAQDSWRVTPHLTVNYGLRYDTTFGLFTGSGRDQTRNPVFFTLQTLQIPLVNGAPHDYRKQFGPRLGIAYSPGKSEKTVFRAGIGLYFNDLAQNGWAAAFQGLNIAPKPCVTPGVDEGCVLGGALIDPKYKTPYAIHASAGIQQALNEHWTVSADWTHETGVHAYRLYSYTAGVDLFSPDPGNQIFVPNVDVARTDNRSRYDAMTIKLQGNMHRVNLTAHYTLATAKTWGCFIGELFDYVNGVCDPLNAFAHGDYGPSGEDVRHRFVLAGVVHAPLGFEVSTMTQVESARPYTLGDGANRATINGVKTSLDQFRGTPFAQVDLRVAHPFKVYERWSVIPFVEFLNLFNRNNPSNNYVADVAALGFIPPEQLGGNITNLCGDPGCNPENYLPIASLNQLRKPAGALGDFFGPGTTVGIPFAAQFGVRLTF